MLWPVTLELSVLYRRHIHIWFLMDLLQSENVVIPLKTVLQVDRITVNNMKSPRIFQHFKVMWL